LLQQPLGHVVALQLCWHTRLLHDSPLPHVSQVAPPLPQALSLVPSTHCPSKVQQPLEHVCGLHVAVG
jgi:hypothetical protein